MSAPDFSRLLDDNQPTIDEFLTYVWRIQKELTTTPEESSLLQRTFELHDFDEEMNGIRSNYYYNRWMENLDPIERTNLDLRGSFILMIAAQAMAVKHDKKYDTKGRKEDATQLPIGAIIRASRNQALHFHEDEQPRKGDRPTWECLSKAYGNFFKFPSQCSYGGFIITNVLKWNDFDTLRADIRSSA